MSRLSDQIQKLIDPFPGSFSELARSAGIDRSTLYKIANGKRLPTHRQLKTCWKFAMPHHNSNRISPNLSI